MKRLARAFERLIEGFLKRNLDKHTKVLSWCILLLLAACMTASFLLADYELRLKGADGVERRAPLMELLLGSEPRQE